MPDIFIRQGVFPFRKPLKVCGFAKLREAGNIEALIRVIVNVEIVHSRLMQGRQRKRTFNIFAIVDKQVVIAACKALT